MENKEIVPVIELIETVPLFYGDNPRATKLILKKRQSLEKIPERDLLEFIEEQRNAFCLREKRGIVGSTQLLEVYLNDFLNNYFELNEHSTSYPPIRRAPVTLGTIEQKMDGIMGKSAYSLDF